MRVVDQSLSKSAKSAQFIEINGIQPGRLRRMEIVKLSKRWGTRVPIKKKAMEKFINVQTLQTPKMKTTAEEWHSALGRRQTRTETHTHTHAHAHAHTHDLSHTLRGAGAGRPAPATHRDPRCPRGAPRPRCSIDGRRGHPCCPARKGCGATVGGGGCSSGAQLAKIQTMFFICTSKKKCTSRNCTGK